jgi:hypothetical protein
LNFYGKNNRAKIVEMPVCGFLLTLVLELRTKKKTNNLLCKENFFPPKFSFPKYKRKNWLEKN